MKSFLKLVILPAAVFMQFCAKQPIPGDREKYTGNWRQTVTDPSEVYEIDINANGTGRHSVVKPGSTVEFKGNVYFTDFSEFTIGGKIIKKKVKADRIPVKIVESTKPYKFHYEATFNGIEYTKK